MVRETQLTTLAQGRRMRVTKLDSCGRPVYGDGSSVTSDGFVSVAASLTTSDTDAIEVKNANGRRVIYRAPKSSFGGYGIEIQMAEVDPELYSLVTGQPIFYDADGRAVGFGSDTSVDPDDSGFALEIWAGVTGNEGCDDEDAEGSWGYILFPYIKGGNVGDHTIENDAITFTLTGGSTSDGNGWGKGPYDVTLNNGATPADPKVPGPLLTALSPTLHELFIPVLVTPPEALAGTRPLLPRSAANLTAVTPTVAGPLAAPVAALGSKTNSATGFAAGTYFWKVTAINAFGETVGSNEVTATLVLNDHQTISWAAITGATGYKLYRGTAAGAENKLIATVGAVTSVVDDGLPGTTASLPVTNTTGSRLVSFAVVPDTLAGIGVWYEFGDGTWDYADSPGDITHVYDEPGTYTVQASSNGYWVIHSVTVPGV